MADFIAESFGKLKQRGGADGLLLASLEKMFRDLEGQVKAVSSEFERYKGEMKKDREFLLKRLDDSMGIHVDEFRKKVEEVHFDVGKLEGEIIALKKQIADLRDTKTNNNMNG